MYSKQSLNRSIAILLGLFCILLMPENAFAQRGSLNWKGWSFDYEVGVELDGIAIRDVKFQGKKVLERGSFPAMPVYYRNNSCGPYLDRLDTDLERVPWANNDKVVSREFRVNGERWYELGIRQFIGQYDIYQVWYFNGAGIIDAHLFSRGLQCRTLHQHYPHWRLDFDIAGGDNDQILRRTSSGLQPYTTEFNVRANKALGHEWVVRDTETGDYVELSLDTGTWNVAGRVVPETTYSRNRVAGRLHRSGEEDWGSRGHGSLPSDWKNGRNRINYGDGENINGKDIVLWYSGYLPHRASEGSELWHSTGVRMTWVPNTDTPQPTPGNIALGKRATASSQRWSTSGPSNVVDGNLSNRWVSAKNSGNIREWVQVDLGRSYAINRVALHWNPRFAKVYEIQTSLNGSNWTTIYTTLNSDGDVDNLTGLSGTGRYIRMVGIQSSSVEGYYLKEFEVYGNPR